MVSRWAHILTRDHYSQEGAHWEGLSCFASTRVFNLRIIKGFQQLCCVSSNSTVYPPPSHSVSQKTAMFGLHQGTPRVWLMFGFWKIGLSRRRSEGGKNEPPPCLCTQRKVTVLWLRDTLLVVSILVYDF